MKILVITQKVDENDDVLGFFTYWIKNISTEVDEVKIICLQKGKFNLPPNVNVFSLGREWFAPKFIQGILFYIYAFYSLLNVEGVFVHMAPEYVKALYPLNVLFKKPIVMWYAHIKVSENAKWAIERVNYVLTPSKESFSLDSPKVIATGHGIDTNLFKPMEKEKIGDVVTISRISLVKRFETLIEAANILVNEYKINLTFNIYGQPARIEDDEYLKKLKSMCKKYNLENNIFWKGAISNKETNTIYNSHKIFVRMQGGGGFGKTELEAMACGLPAITPTPVYKNDLGKYFGDLYFEEDDAKTLALKIKNVLEWNSSTRDDYSNIARDLVEKNHNIKNVAKEVVSLLKKASLG